MACVFKLRCRTIIPLYASIFLIVLASGRIMQYNVEGLLLHKQGITKQPKEIHAVS